MRQKEKEKVEYRQKTERRTDKRQIEGSRRLGKKKTKIKKIYISF